MRLGFQLVSGDVKILGVDGDRIILARLVFELNNGYVVSFKGIRLILGDKLTRDNVTTIRWRCRLINVLGRRGRLIFATIRPLDKPSSKGGVTGV